MLIKDIIIICILPVIQQVKLVKHKIKWRRLNKHNKTYAKCLFPINSVIVGKYTYGLLDLDFYGDKNEKITIGNFCSIADNVKFLAGGGHTYTNLSTYPFKCLLLKEDIIEAVSKGPITVCDDVWIGYGAVILSGITIGQGAIVGAGSIVTKDIPPYAIYAGTKVVKYRFCQETIKKLLTVDYKKVDETYIKNNIDVFYSEPSSVYFGGKKWEEIQKN